MLCNLTYAQMTSRCLDEESRKRLDDELTAPPGGRDAADRAFWQAVVARARPEED